MGTAKDLTDRARTPERREHREEKRERPQGSADSALRYRKLKRDRADGAQRCCAPTLGVELLR